MEVKILNSSEFQNYIYSNYRTEKKLEELEENIRFFQCSDFNSLFFASDNFKNSLKYILLVTGKKLVGISKIAIYDNDKDAVSCSYISVHKNYRGKGLSKILIDATFVCIKTNNVYDGKVFRTSGYTPSGYKYLRNYLLSTSEKHGIEIIDNYVEYPDSETKEGYSDEFFKLVKYSKNIYKQKYPNTYVF